MLLLFAFAEDVDDDDDDAWISREEWDGDLVGVGPSIGPEEPEGASPRPAAVIMGFASRQKKMTFHSASLSASRRFIITFVQGPPFVPLIDS